MLKVNWGPAEGMDNGDQGRPGSPLRVTSFLATHDEHAHNLGCTYVMLNRCSTPLVFNPSTKSVNVQCLFLLFNPHLLGQSDLQFTFTYKLDFVLHSFWIEQIYYWIVKLIVD